MLCHCLLSPSVEYTNTLKCYHTHTNSLSLANSAHLTHSVDEIQTSRSLEKSQNGLLCRFIHLGILVSKAHPPQKKEKKIVQTGMLCTNTHVQVLIHALTHSHKNINLYNISNPFFFVAFLIFFLYKCKSSSFMIEKSYYFI